MGFLVPIINKDSVEIQASIRERLRDEKLQKKLVLTIVAIALLLDNMLYMVIVPIIPSYLRRIEAYEEIKVTEKWVDADGFMHFNETGEIQFVNEDTMLGYLFASKAIVQLIVNPFSGTLIDRVGYEYPLIFGLLILFFSTTIFAIGESYYLLFLARSIQGLGSAFADTSGLAMIADRFTEEHERSAALGIALAFISFGCLTAPPFGGALYDWVGKPFPFLILAMLSLIDALLVFLVIHPKVRRTEEGERLQGTPIWRLLMDPYIAVCSGALIMANVSLAFLEPTIGTWMGDEMPGVSEFEIGLVWLPAFFPHVAGVYLTVVLMRKYPQHPWVLTAVGLILEGTSCFMLPWCKSFALVMLPLSILCFGIALIDTSILPLLGHLVDTRHVSVYGSVYAIADISYSMAYAFGPIVAGKVVQKSSFFRLNMGICVSNLLYAPTLALLRTVYYCKASEAAELQDATGKQYGTSGDDGYYGENGIENRSVIAAGPNFNPDAPKSHVEWKDTMYDRKVKNKHQFRDYKDTDAILGGDDEDDEGDGY